MRQSADEPSVSTGTRKHVVLVTDAGPHGGLRDRLERFAAGGGPEEALVRVALPDQPNTPPAVIEIAGPNAVDPTVLASDLGVDSRAVQVYAVVEQLRWA